MFQNPSNEHEEKNKGIETSKIVAVEWKKVVFPFQKEVGGINRTHTFKCLELNREAPIKVEGNQLEIVSTAPNQGV